MTNNPIHGALFGVAIGDALGVPAEFTSREELKLAPIEDFIGYKSHRQPPGTFSDDSSLTFCLAESLCNGYDLFDISTYFIQWTTEAYWTAHNHVFDIGITTARAIHRLREDVPPQLAGGNGEFDNGNGSLMRILPLVFYTRGLDIDKRYQCAKEVSSITHGHERSILACFYYLEFARELLATRDKHKAYANTAKIFNNWSSAELKVFDPLINNDISQQPIEAIRSTGYVMHTLMASIYCLLTTSNYKEAVLKAINMGEDTDTTGAVTGGLAGLYYGYESIPEHWRKNIARTNDIYDLCERLSKALQL